MLSFELSFDLNNFENASASTKILSRTALFKNDKKKILTKLSY